VNSRFLLLNFVPFTGEFFDFAVELRGWTGEYDGATVEFLGWTGEFRTFPTLQNKNFL